MPELPEVETIRKDLTAIIIGAKIKSVDIHLNKQVNNAKQRFLKLVEGQKIKSIQRRAKLLIIALDNGYYLVFHLKMTGQLIYQSRPSKRKKGLLAGGGHPIKSSLVNLPNKYSHVVFKFNDGSQLFFNDTRQFGWVKLVNAIELEKIKQAFGPEPLDIKQARFIEIFKNRKAVIKTFLMNPQVLAGVGNIYAQEALFCAGIKPTKRANQISRAKLVSLHGCLQKILKLAIKHKGTSADDYVDAFGRAGSMQPYLEVYQRQNKKCKQCKTKLKLIKQGQRSTVYCPKCQK